jgi:hypothetical protein
MLRRLGDALRRQDPATVLIELLVLVIGIALGLQVDQWNADREHMYAMTLMAPGENGSNINPGGFDFDRMRGDPEFDGALGVQISVQANNKELQIAQLEAARDVLERLAVRAPQ